MTKACVITQIILLLVFSGANAQSNKMLGDIKMVYVEGGVFQMGSRDGERDERPIHNVKISSFYMSAYEITNAQYCEFLNAKGNQSEDGVKWIDLENRFFFIQYENGVFSPKPGFENKPASAITWYGANAYCKWKGGRLPTESEWEYVAKGGKHQHAYMFSGSDNAAEVAWYAATSGGRPQEVGKKKENALGIYDMTGNAWEWVYDWHGLYSVKEYDNPKGQETGQYKIIRGGSWTSFGTDNLRNTARIVMLPTQVANVTFRLCMDSESKKQESQQERAPARVAPPGF